MLQLEVGKIYFDSKGIGVKIMSITSCLTNEDKSEGKEITYYLGDNGQSYRSDGVVLKLNEDDDIAQPINLVSKASFIRDIPMPPSVKSPLEVKVGRMYLDRNGTLVVIQNGFNGFIEGAGFGSTYPIFRATNGKNYFTNGGEYRLRGSSDASPLSYLTKEVSPEEVNTQSFSSKHETPMTKLTIETGKNYKTNKDNVISILRTMSLGDMVGFVGSDDRFYDHHGLEYKKTKGAKDPDQVQLIEEVPLPTDLNNEPTEQNSFPGLKVGATYITVNGAFVYIMGKETVHSFINLGEALTVYRDSERRLYYPDGTRYFGGPRASSVRVSDDIAGELVANTTETDMSIKQYVENIAINNVTIPLVNRDEPEIEDWDSAVITRDEDLKIKVGRTYVDSDKKFIYIEKVELLARGHTTLFVYIGIPSDPSSKEPVSMYTESGRGIAVVNAFHGYDQPKDLLFLGDIVAGL